jgi:hypothetical protein
VLCYLLPVRCQLAIQDLGGGGWPRQRACKPLRQACSKAPSSVTGLNYATSLAVLMPNEVDTGQGQAENNADPDSRISGGDWVTPVWS